MYDLFVLSSCCINFTFFFSSNSCYCRGTGVNPMHRLKALRKACKWSQIMIPMVMGNLSSVKSLYINLYIPLNLYLEPSLIQLLTFVYGPLGMFLRTWIFLLSLLEMPKGIEMQNTNLSFVKWIFFLIPVYLIQVWTSYIMYILDSSIDLLLKLWIHCNDLFCSCSLFWSSLAHSELSSVFYDKVLLLAWGYVQFMTCFLHYYLLLLMK